MAKQRTQRQRQASKPRPSQKPKAAAVTQAPVDTFASEIERTALTALLVFGLLAVVTVWIFNASRESIPIAPDRGSVGFQGLMLSMLAAVVITPIAYMRSNRYRNENVPAPLRRKYTWMVVPITIAVTLLVALIVAASFELITHSFQGVELSRISASLRLGTYIGTLSYFLVVWVMRMRGSNLVYIAVFYLFATLLVAGATNENPMWYQGSFSYLGMTESNSKFIFNLGLPFTGILIVIWTFYFTDYLDVLKHENVITDRTRTLIHYGLILTGILLSFVGIVRFGMGSIGNIIHDVSATGMGVVLGVMMLFMPRLIDRFSRIFYVYSYVVVGLLITAVVLFVMGVYSLTGLELAAFSMAAVWLIIFYRNTVELTEHVRPDLKF